MCFLESITPARLVAETSNSSFPISQKQNKSNLKISRMTQLSLAKACNCSLTLTFLGNPISWRADGKWVWVALKFFSRIPLRVLPQTRPELRPSDDYDGAQRDKGKTLAERRRVEIFFENISRFRTWFSCQISPRVVEVLTMRNFFLLNSDD